MMAISVVGSSFRICASSRREAFASLLSAAELKPNRIPAAKDTLTAGKPLASVTCSTWAPSILQLRQPSCPFCVRWQHRHLYLLPRYCRANGCPLAFTYQSADNGTCCCTGATADYSPLALLFIVPQLPSSNAPHKSNTVNFIFFITLFSLKV